ncbi:hypothetical protein, partial [uncultured Bradyrhizobium sp.]|uniref:hypothetical protein n=1 Tax=uncultured Bradyrhizobium sp. TaxID=199684 RepID=UPI0035CA6ABE
LRKGCALRCVRGTRPVERNIATRRNTRRVNRGLDRVSVALGKTFAQQDGLPGQTLLDAHISPSLPGLNRQSIPFETIFRRWMDTRVKAAYDDLVRCGTMGFKLNSNACPPPASAGSKPEPSCRRCRPLRIRPPFFETGWS